MSINSPVSFSLIFAFFSISQLLLALLIFIPKFNVNRQVRLFCCLLAVTALYLLAKAFPDLNNYSLLWWLVFTASNLLPGLFFLTSLSVFSDHFDMKGSSVIWAFSPAVVLFLQTLIQLTNPSLSGISEVLIKVALALDISLVGFALYVALKNWRNDLVAERRMIRGGVISILAIYIILVIINGQILQIQNPLLEDIEMLLLFILISGLNYYLLKPNMSTLFEPPKRNIFAPAVVHSADEIKPDQAQLDKVTQAMSIDKLYLQSDLTITGLASHLHIPEHRLRRLINGALGYRNFNDFLNHYRINEMSKKLADQQFAQLPILTLSLESGFRSLSSFNKAFKAEHGVTPSEYRRKNKQ